MSGLTAFYDASFLYPSDLRNLLMHLALTGQNTALSTQIYSNVTQPGGEPLAWGAALTLIALVVLLTLVLAAR